MYPELQPLSGKRNPGPALHSRGARLVYFTRAGIFQPQQMFFTELLPTGGQRKVLAPALCKAAEFGGMMQMGQRFHRKSGHFGTTFAAYAEHFIAGYVPIPPGLPLA